MASNTLYRLFCTARQKASSDESRLHTSMSWARDREIGCARMVSKHTRWRFPVAQVFRSIVPWQNCVPSAL